ncbi:efflux RND transporter periplasmic adaptor subunit [Nitrospirillum sp. BR 11828]|uniref:efflux RND transporter periplasmic adaptor subunit n=1 Tax=Nitrospirillum sp. BR 11828 TaxID=3104325 RepID=UPI002ACAD951|nr:efflux RND transporter periplasmic adaptor subunit [Nitrospirillum sp. BR 11828]MDZ5648683.1 efflux RND transporter periplasmic adaptor subunit [Nitrospirillum sp. BR 11828]
MLKRLSFSAPVGAPLLSLLVLTACDKKQEVAAPPPPQVGYVVLHTQTVPLKAELAGRTSAHRVSDVRPQVAGIIQKRLFEEGALVQAGQLLYQIDPAPYEAAYEQAQGNLANAEANLISLKSKAERYAELVKVEGVSRQDYDDARAAYQQGQATIVADRAAVKAAKVNLDYTRITAPISGRIGRSSITEGALVTADQTTALATITQLDPIYVDITQSSMEMTALKRRLMSGGLGKGDAQATLKLEDGSAYPTPGTLKFAEVSVDQDSGAVTLRALFPNPQEMLLPGMYVRTTVEQGVMPNAILAPQQGVSRNPKSDPIALVVTADNKVEQRLLTVDRTVGDKWLVTDGLKEGDRLIVEGSMKARVGQAVTPVEVDLSAKAPTSGSGK